MIEEISLDMKIEYSEVSEKLGIKQLRNEFYETLSMDFQTCEETVIIDGKKKKVISAIINNEKTIFAIANITYLGHPHAGNKKRIQIKEWWIKLYNEYKTEAKLKIVGLYSYKGNKIFVDFDIEKYVENKANNSSAHVLTHDLYQAMEYEYFEKIDSRNNKISVVRKENFNKYLLGGIKGNNSDILECITEFNKQFNFDNWKLGIDVYQEMYDANYKNTFQSEWPGYYLEYAMENFLTSKNTNVLQMYSGKSDDKLDFDMYSKKYNFYLDLKCSNITETKTILNDTRNIDKAIEEHGKIWFVMYQHETKKDKDYGLETCTFWNKLKIADGRKNVKLTSYKDRMKHSVKFDNMLILEVNKQNANQIFLEYKQGKNSNGKDRKPKYMINKKNIDNFIIFNYKGGM